MTGLTGIYNCIRTVTVFEFKVFDKGGNKDWLYDATPEQCCLHLWKKHPSAHITEMVEFGVQDFYTKKIDWAELRKINNPYAQGHDEDMNKRTQRLKTEAEEIKKFRNKHKLE